MAMETFEQFQAEFFRLYQGGQYEQAWDLIQAHGEKYIQDQVGYIYNWRMCLASLMGLQEKAIQIFQEAVDQGLWWGQDTLRNDPDLASLQGRPEFERLANLCAERYSRVQRESQPELITFLPGTTTPRPSPLLLGMHGRGGNAGEFGRHWQSLPAQGWLVALSQSAQVVNPNSFCWDDLDRAVSQVRAHYEALCDQHPVDPRNVVLAGFSQGGGLAIHLALSGAIPARGFIAVAPFVQDSEELARQVQVWPGRQLRGYLITGDQDPLKENFASIEAVLQSTGIEYQRQEHTGLAHAFPPTFAESLQTALAFFGIERLLKV